MPISVEALLGHADSLRALARSLLRDEAAAEDVVQDTWVAVLERPPARVASHASHSSIEGWLHVVARHIALKRARGEASRANRERAAARPEPVASAAGVAERKAVLKDVVDAVMALPEPYQSVVFLRYFEGLPPRAVARELGRPIVTVRSQLSRGLALLRRRLDAEYGGDRGRWTGAVLALSASGRDGGGTITPVEAAWAGRAGLWTGALLMSTNLKIAGVAAVAAGLLWWLAGVESVVPPLEVAPIPAEVVDARRPAPLNEELVASARATPPVPAAPVVAKTQAPAAPEPKAEAVAAELPPFLTSSLDPVEREFASELKLELVKVTVAGQPMDLTGESPGTVVADHEVEVTDVPYQIGFGGRPRLRRTFDVVHGGVNMKHLTSGGVGPGPTRLAGRSALQGRTVDFRWDASSADWIKGYVPSADGTDPPPDELLTGLAHDMDLVAFAPPAGTLPGGSWSIEPRALRSWLAPGGDLALEFDASDPAVLGGPTGFWSLAQGMEHARGTVTATLEKSGAHGDAITLEFELELDLEEPFEIQEGSGVQAELKVRLAYEIAGTARVEWDAAAQRVSRLSAEADVALAMTIAGRAGPEGAIPDVACELEGSAQWSVESKARPAGEPGGAGR